MPSNVQNINCISRATSGRLPSNDEILFGANIWISIRFCGSFQRFCSLHSFESSVSQKMLQNVIVIRIYVLLLSFISRHHFEVVWRFHDRNISSDSFLSLVVQSSIKGSFCTTVFLSNFRNSNIISLKHQKKFIIHYKDNNY